MNIIRDDELNGLLMIPLLNDWRITRCNVKNCKEKPTTIITGIKEVPKFGMCESHYQKVKDLGKINVSLEFNLTPAEAGKK